MGEADRRADLLRAELKLLEERERTRQRFADMLRDTLAQLEGSRGEAPAREASSTIYARRPIGSNSNLPAGELHSPASVASPRFGGSESLPPRPRWEA